MYIEKKVKLKNNIYYVQIEVNYKVINSRPTLCLKNYKGDYYDGGDLSNLINKIEKNYTEGKARYYDNVIGFMADVLYIYDRIPFLIGIKDVYISNNDICPYSMGYISKEEIDKYITDNNIKMNKNTEFKLSNELTWYV